MAVLSVLPGTLSVADSLVHEGEDALGIRKESTVSAAACAGWLLTAIISRVIIRPELLAVVTSADKISFTSGMAIIDPAVKRSITVALSFVARILRSTTPSAFIIPPATPLVGRRV